MLSNSRGRWIPTIFLYSLLLAILPFEALAQIETLEDLYPFFPEENKTYSPRLNAETRLFTCGGEERLCCGPPASQRSAINPPYCDETLGCNVITNRCEKPCGKPGQVCCDGPDTVAPRTGYSPNSRLLKPMCEAAICDGASRRCVTNCGMNSGDSCCGPQPPLAVASCIIPSLVCVYYDTSLCLVFS